MACLLGVTDDEYVDGMASYFVCVTVTVAIRIIPTKMNEAMGQVCIASYFVCLCVTVAYMECFGKAKTNMDFADIRYIFGRPIAALWCVYDSWSI